MIVPSADSQATSPFSDCKRRVRAILAAPSDYAGTAPRRRTTSSTVVECPTGPSNCAARGAKKARGPQLRGTSKDYRRSVRLFKSSV